MFTLFQDENDEWRYRIKGKNGEILVTSEGYTTQRDASRGLGDLADVVGGSLRAGFATLLTIEPEVLSFDPEEEQDATH